MSHVTNMNESWHAYEWVMAHIRTSHGTHMNESWHTYECVMAHVYLSHGTYLNESWHTYEWAKAHIWMSNGTHMNKSWRIYKLVMAYILTSHGTHMNESWHTYEWVIAHIWMRYGTHMKARVRSFMHPSVFAPNICTNVCLSVSESESESVSMFAYESVSMSVFGCPYVCVNKIIYIYIYAHSCTRIHKQKKCQKKGGQCLIAVHGMYSWTVDCNALQLTASHCLTLQHTATHCITLHHTASHCNARQRTATQGMVVPNSNLSVVLSRIHWAGYYTFTHTRTQTCIRRRNSMDVLEGYFSWLTHSWCMSHLHMWCKTHFDFNVVHDSFTYAGHDLFLCFMWDKSHSFKWDSLRYGKRLVHEFDKHNLYVWHDSFMCVTRDWYAGNTFISGDMSHSGAGF